MGNDITKKDGGITYHFSPTVRLKSQKAVQEILSEIREKSCKNKDFFNNLNIYACGQWDEMDYKYCDNDYAALGFVKDPIYEKSKRINLHINRSFKQEHKIGAIFNPTLSTKELKHSIAHELGHIFAFYFATPDIELFDKTKAYVESTKDINLLYFDREFLDLYNQYAKQNELSDSEEFKDAWQKDIEIAFKGKSKTENKDLLDALGYFSPNFFDPTYEDGNFHVIILEDGINDKELDYSDNARNEIFAQLFSYAMGTCDDEEAKHLIVNTYKHSYEVVKKYINEYLGTNTKGHYVPRTQNKLNCNG